MYQYCKEVGPRTADQIYEIWNCTVFVTLVFRRKSKLCIIYVPTIHRLKLIFMNNRHIHLSNFLIKLKIGIFAHLSLSIFLYPHPSIQKVLIYKESSENALNVCGYKNWIKVWGVCELWKNNILILLISTQKLYFGDDDAIYDVIIQEPVWKWRHNYRHRISRDPFAKWHTQPFSFLDKPTGPILPFVVLALWNLLNRFLNSL